MRLTYCFSSSSTRHYRVLGHSVGAKDGDDWRRMRSCVDPHFTLDKAFALLPTMISDTDIWLKDLPSLPNVRKAEKGDKLYIKAEELVSELPFKLIARRLFGDQLDDKVIIYPTAFFSRCH
jgi:gliotoxin/aspirochlorine/mycotoxins biosynthesis cytochrome P450 monooxygenase